MYSLKTLSNKELKKAKGINKITKMLLITIISRY